MATAVIDVQNLGRYFGPIKAVDGITFAVNRGDVLGFLGPNGAGKSTTMKMLTGFLTPSFGRATVAGFDPAEDSIESKSRVGYLPENAPLYDDMSVKELLEFILKVRRVSPELKKAAFDRAVQLTNIQHVLSQRIETLSKGYRRRVGIAQAIIHDPEVLILDEPTDGLDPNQKREVRTLIRQMSAEKAIILSTHILEEVTAICNRAIVISQGKLVADSNPIELRSRSASAGRVRAVFQQVLNTEDVKALASLPGVHGVESQQLPSGEVVYFIVPQPAHNIASFLLQEFDRRRWKVQGFAVEAGELDDVFRAMTITEPTITGLKGATGSIGAISSNGDSSI